MRGRAIVEARSAMPSSVKAEFTVALQQAKPSRLALPVNAIIEVVWTRNGGEYEV